MHISDYYGMVISGHKDIDFIDVNLEQDNKLFLDPTLIEELPNPICKKMLKVSQSYFQEMFNACENNDTNRINHLASFGKEPNETCLGMTSCGVKGRGNSEELLQKIFTKIAKSNFVNNGLIKDASDICVFVENFAEDRMSDLLTNVLRNEIYQFTLSQSKHHCLPLSESKCLIGKYWNDINLRWEDLYGHALIYKNQIKLLVPKLIVRQTNIVSAGQYLQKIVLRTRQDYHLDNRTKLANMKIDKKGNEKWRAPSKNIVKKNELVGKSEKKYLIEHTLNYPSDIILFREKRIAKTRLHEYTVSDFELDRIIYHQLSKFA